MYKQITNSVDPKVIGITHGGSQVEFFDNQFEKDNYTLIKQLFIDPIKRDIEKYNFSVANSNFPLIHGKLDEKAILTDIMQFDPYFFGCKYLVSQKFLKCLIDLKYQKMNID